MSNGFYNASGTPGTGSFGASSAVRSEFLLIQAGFDKMPALSSGVANTAIVVNSGGTGLTNTAGTLALAAAFATTGGFGTTLAEQAATTLTLPAASDTLVGRNTTDTLTNKTLGAVTLAGMVSGGGQQINNVVIGASNPLSGSFTSLLLSSTATFADSSTWTAAGPQGPAATSSAFGFVKPDGTTLSNSSGAISINLGKANNWTAVQTAGNYGYQVFTSNGTFTVPSSASANSRFKFTVIGGGGGGGGGGTVGGGNGGGGQGGASIYFATGLTASSTNAVVVGAGGASNANGTSSSVVVGATTITGTGGQAGAVATTNVANPTSNGYCIPGANGGAGGSSTNGSINLGGQSGANGAPGSSQVQAGYGGAGGGVGGGGGGTLGAGQAGQAPGAGGGGGVQPGGAGGAGAAGIVIVEWWL